MSQIINTNMSSMFAQRSLNSTQASQQTAMERLSSGKRINSAADDAAGLAIAETMTAQIKGANQAIKNVNDGVSYVQTADGALGEVQSLLQRVRELKVQSLNGTNTADQIGYMNTEFAALVDEIGGIIERTSFNEHGSLTDGVKTIQTGWEDDVTMEVGIADLQDDTEITNVTGTITDTTGAAATDAMNGAGAAAVTLGEIDTAIKHINTQRATLGSQQNRLEHISNNLQSFSENITASKSQIMDADFAAESAELARTNVLQQAGMAMLAQANQAPNNILALIK